MNKKLHIICFDVPFPATYGGVIDVFHRIRSLSEKGTEIYLHVFKYGRQEQRILDTYCAEVHYYQRKTSFIKSIGLLPYIVKSRSDARLIGNLQRIQAPILFEGLHTTLLLKKNLFKDRKLLVRTHNIEHFYYKQLAKNEANIFKKVYYAIEGLRLKYYERVLRHSDHVLPVSREETNYFKEKYGEKVIWLPAFHPNRSLHELSKKGYFALFHGNLTISDNMKAAHLLIEIFKSIPYPLVIAGRSKDKKLLSRIDQHKHISFIRINEDDQLLELFHRAHVNVLFSFNNSGVKLKLINALFQSRFVIGNSKVIDGSGMASLCVIANEKKEIINQVMKIFEKDFSEKDLKQRRELLSGYDNDLNAKILQDLL